MSTRQHDENSEGESAPEQTRHRHEQLFGHPPRIAPLSRSQYADQIIRATTKLSNTISGKAGPAIPLDFCPDLVATLLRYPELWDRLSMLSAQLQCAHARLPGRSRQLAVMRTVWLCRAPYQWGEHLSRTRAAGVSDEEIEQIKNGSSDRRWNSLDRAIMAAVEEFREDKFVSDGTWCVLAEHFDEAQLLELLVLIGQFASVAFLLNSLRLPLEQNNKGFFS